MFLKIKIVDETFLLVGAVRRRSARRSGWPRRRAALEQRVLAQVGRKAFPVEVASELKSHPAELIFKSVRSWLIEGAFRDQNTKN